MSLSGLPESMIRIIKFRGLDRATQLKQLQPKHLVESSESGDYCLGGSPGRMWISARSGQFNLKSSDEIVLLETTGDCSDSYRKVQIVKSAGVTPFSSNVRGMFHKFEVAVTDRSQKTVGEMIFEPESGACLLPEKGACRDSGKMTVGRVELVFWFLKN